MEAEERARRVLQAAGAGQTEMRSILRLKRIATKGTFELDLLTSVEMKELCALVLRHLTWMPKRGAEPGSTARERLPETSPPGPTLR